MRQASKAIHAKKSNLNWNMMESKRTNRNVSYYSQKEDLAKPLPPSNAEKYYRQIIGLEI
jgi:hypothetical protein